MTGPLKPSCSNTLFFPSPLDQWQAPPSPEPEFFPANATPFEERELLDVCTFLDDDDLVEVVRIAESPKPLVAAGAYGERYIQRQANGHSGRASSVEAPAKTEYSTAKNAGVGSIASSPAHPTRIFRSAGLKFIRKLGKQHSFPSDIDREEAWQRKKELYGMEELPSRGERERIGCNVLRSVSDCGERTFCLDKACGRTRTRSLTDDDLEELRGCIDLGFGFSTDEDCDLSGILPALDLYYAINRQYLESKTRLSPASPREAGSMLSGTSANDSPVSDSWRVSSPGDTPSQVKTRLRHWAQAVACSVKQGFSL